MKLPVVYALVDIGCLDCGEPSRLIGAFDNWPEAFLLLEKEAKMANEQLNADGASFSTMEDGGLHRIQILSTHREE